MSAYAAAGVSVDAGERAVELMAGAVARASRPEVVGGLGGFAGMFAFNAAAYQEPLLVTSTDGVGTKIAIARALDRHDTIGLDLVGMVIDDIVVVGAEPLFMTDYIATGKVDPERIAAIVTGIAHGCELAGAALVGGETAEHPGLMSPGEYDLAGAVTGVVERSRLLGAERVREGDVVIAMASSGLHSNGYSLVRKIVADAGLDLQRTPPGWNLSLGEELLTPTRIYAKDCLALADEVDVHAFAHITGGGLVDNVRRVVPTTVDLHLQRSSWTPPQVFSFLADAGAVSRADAEQAWNQGIGMVAVVASDAAERAVAVLSDREVPAWICGEATSGVGQVHLVGDHA